MATKSKVPKAKPTKAKAPSSEQLPELAMAGDLDALYAWMDTQNRDAHRDLALYKWLAVASDFGHEEADDAMSDMHESSSLRYDDDQGETGNIHFELAVAYLTGTDGLPRDLQKGRNHLGWARENRFPEQIQGTKALLTDTRKQLGADARAVFDAIYNGKPYAGSTDDEDDGD